MREYRGRVYGSVSSAERIARAVVPTGRMDRDTDLSDLARWRRDVCVATVLLHSMPFKHPECRGVLHKSCLISSSFTSFISTLALYFRCYGIDMCSCVLPSAVSDVRG